MHVRGKNQIKLYSLTEGFLVDSIKYETEGPTAIRRVYDFHIINEDSILLNHRYHYKMSMVDQDLNISKEFTFLPDGVELDPKTQIPTSGDTYLVVFNHNEPVMRRKYRDWETDRKSTRLNSSHSAKSRMPSSA